MHPILISRTRLAFYLLAWVPLGAAGALLLAGPGRLPWTQGALTAGGLALFYALVCLSPWYSGRHLPFQPSAIGKLLLNHTAAAVVAAALLTGIARAAGVPGSQQAFLFGAGVLLYLLAVALHYVLFSFENSREAERRMQEARVQAREAELKALKAQINPHFLFNSLNSISALAPGDGLRAREMCLRLSDFLRSTLALAEEEIVPIEREFELAQTYLDVERVRFGERLRVALTLEAGCGGCTVPALILQPLVENAVKHGIAGLVEGGAIRLEAACTDGVLRIAVENDFDPESSSRGGNGLGLANVRERLRTFYGNRARVTAEAHDGRFAVNLELPCEK